MTRPQCYTLAACACLTLVYLGGLLAWEFLAWARWGPSARITDTIRTPRLEFGWVVALLASVAMLTLGGLIVHFASGKPEDEESPPPGGNQAGG